VANAYQNQDLFWALRGGGGGTFGVVTQVTMRVHQDVPVCIADLAISGSQTDLSFWTQGVAALLANLKSLNQEGTAGQFVLRSLPEEAVNASLTVYFLNLTNTSYAEERMHSTRTLLDRNKITYTFSPNCQAKVSSTFRTGPDIYPEDYGILMGSVLVSRDLFNSVQGPSRLTHHFSQLPMGPGDLLFTSNLGGRITANENLTDTAMHPAWRESAQLVNFVRRVQPSSQGKATALEELNEVQMPKLYEIEPNFKVSYRNLGDPREKEASQVYWGKNYRRLLEIKQKWDPKGLFFSQLGVGSEHWDAEGICRRQRRMDLLHSVFY
jgi:hypothetical protein